MRGQRSKVPVSRCRCRNRVHTCSLHLGIRRRNLLSLRNFIQSLIQKYFARINRPAHSILFTEPHPPQAPIRGESFQKGTSMRNLLQKSLITGGLVFFLSGISCADSRCAVSVSASENGTTEISQRYMSREKSGRGTFQMVLSEAGDMEHVGSTAFINYDTLSAKGRKASRFVIKGALYCMGASRRDWSRFLLRTSVKSAEDRQIHSAAKLRKGGREPVLS